MTEPTDTEEAIRAALSGRSNIGAGKVPPAFLPPVVDGLPTTPSNLFPVDLTGKGTRGNSNGQYVKVDPNQVENTAVQFDTHGYNLADADFLKRFPELAAGRNYNIADSQNQLNGGLGAQTQQALSKAGLGDLNFGANEYQKARNMGVPIAAMEQRDRGYFSRLLADNPQRTFGLNGQDIAHIALANTNGKNVYNQGTYGLRVQSAIASTQQGAQNQAAIIGGLGSLVGAGLKAGIYGAHDAYTSAGGYGPTNPWASSYGNPSAPSGGTYGGA